MDDFLITHYYYKGTDPWKNIMLLSEERAFETAKMLSAAHPDMQCFGRFADFDNYYPLRKAADEEVRRQFIICGGKPRLEHPYSFVLGECEYLKKWYGDCEILHIPLKDISEDIISFTAGDSCARLQREGAVEVMTKSDLSVRIDKAGGIEQYMKNIAPYAYIEVQLWDRVRI